MSTRVSKKRLGTIFGLCGSVHWTVGVCIAHLTSQIGSMATAFFLFVVSKGDKGGKMSPKTLRDTPWYYSTTIRRASAVILPKNLRLSIRIDRSVLDIEGKNGFDLAVRAVYGRFFVILKTFWAPDAFGPRGQFLSGMMNTSYKHILGV